MSQPIVGGTFRGAWQTFTQYAPGDVVTWQGTVYHVTAKFTSGGTFNTNNLLSVPAAATAGTGLKVKEGTDAAMGMATLVAGSAVVTTHIVTATSRIFVCSNADGGTPGWLRVSTRVAGTSFTITSSSGTDTSTVAWMIVEPAP